MLQNKQTFLVFVRRNASGCITYRILKGVSHECAIRVVEMTIELLGREYQRVKRWKQMLIASSWMRCQQREGETERELEGRLEEVKGAFHIGQERRDAA
jgi:hypothetical protein